MIDKIIAFILVIVAICLFFIDECNIPHTINTILVFVDLALLAWLFYRGSKKKRKSDISK